MAIRDNPIAAAAMGINTALYKTADLRRQRALYRGRRRARRDRGAVRRAGQLHVPAVDIVAGRAGDRRRRLDPGKPVRRRVRAVRAEYRRDASRPGLPGAIYGVILLLVIFVMPSGAAGFARARARLGDPRTASLRANPNGGRPMTRSDPPHDPRRGARARSRFGAAAGARAEEIRHRRQRHRDQDRQHRTRIAARPRPMA